MWFIWVLWQTEKRPILFRKSGWKNLFEFVETFVVRLFKTVLNLRNNQTLFVFKNENKPPSIGFP